MSALLTAQDLKVLSAPFPKERVGAKIGSLSKDRSRGMLVLYLQHTDVYSRLEEVDPSWSAEVTDERIVSDTCVVRVRMTVKGVSRENAGEGGDTKSAISDAVKRAAMLFGVGRYLYDSETVWVEYNESKDKFRQWTFDDFERALKPGQQKTPAQSSADEKKPAAKGPSPSATPAKTIKPKGTEPKAALLPREEANRKIMNLYAPYLKRYPETRFVDLLTARYDVGETRLMTLEQIQNLISYMTERLQDVP